MVASYFTKIRQVLNAPGNQGRRASALLWLPFWFVYKRIGRRGIVVRIFDGLKFRCHPTSLIAEHVLYLSAFVEYDEMHFMQDFLRPDDHVLDIGANVGLHTLLAASRLREGKGCVFAVEPHPENLVILRENISLNALENVTVLAVAAGEADAELPLIDQDVFSTLGEPGESGDNVPVRRLDTLLEGKKFAITKLDVEGYEWHALRGLEKLIQARAMPIVIFELIGHMNRHGLNEADFCSWWHRHGYLLATYDHNSHTLRLTAQPRGDVFAISPEGLEMLRDRLPQVKLR